MKKIEKAFTLVELLVVIVIIGILATITVATWRGDIDTAQEGKQLAEDTQAYKELLAECVLAGRTDCATLTTGGFYGPSAVCGSRNAFNYKYSTFDPDFNEVTDVTYTDVEENCNTLCTLGMFSWVWLNSATTPYYGFEWTGANKQLYVCYPPAITSDHLCGITRLFPGYTRFWPYDAAVTPNSVDLRGTYGRAPVGYQQDALANSVEEVENYCSSNCITGTYTYIPRETLEPGVGDDGGYYICD